MSDDPAVRAAIEATRNHQQTGSTCSCGHPCGDFFYEHVNAVAVEAARPIIEAEKDQEIHAERMVHALQESRLREGKGPRWEDDPIVLENGWDEGRCGACGEHLPKPAAKPGGNR